ncbi:MAG: LuxR C-terminal-related transcriptional regulator [Flavobacteriales bacterium]
MNSIRQLYHRSQHILLYGGVMALLIMLMKWLQWKYLITDNAIDIYIGLLAVTFTALGLWLASQLTKTKVRTVTVEKEVLIPQSEYFVLNEEELNRLELTKREYEVLELITRGQSNADIADRLSLSLSTIKTHVSNVLLKMDVKSRAQAIEKAKRLRITP